MKNEKKCNKNKFYLLGQKYGQDYYCFSLNY